MEFSHGFHYYLFCVNTVCCLCLHKMTQAELLEAQFELTGSDAYAARFGETIANLGDLDDDGYPGNDHTHTAQPDQSALSLVKPD